MFTHNFALFATFIDTPCSTEQKPRMCGMYKESFKVFIIRPSSDGAVFYGMVVSVRVSGCMS